MPEIAITGTGVVSTIGENIPAFTESITVGKSGLTQLERFDPFPFNIRHSYEIKDFKLEGKKSQELLRIDKGGRYAIASIRDVLKQSAYPVEKNPYEVGLVLNASFLGFSAATKYATDVLRSRLTDYRPLQFPNTVPHAMTANAAIEFNIKGPNITIISKQNGVIPAIEYAISLLRMHKVKMVLVGGFDLFDREYFLYFHQLDRIAGVAGPELHIPFARERNGFLLGEGGGVIALERTEDALRRGADILAQICSLSTAYFPCAIHNYLDGNLPCTKTVYDNLLSQAKLTKKDVDGFLSCANSTSDVDAWEDAAIYSYFGKDLPVTAFSSFIGEGCSLEILHILAGCICLRDNFLFPVLGYSPNPDMQSNILHNGPKYYKINNIIVSRLGLGGSYSTILLSKAANKTGD